MCPKTIFRRESLKNWKKEIAQEAIHGNG